MELLYITLGWLFGLLTPPISSRIDRKYKEKDFRFAICSELKNLATRIAGLSFKVHLHLGSLDKPSLRWIGDVYKKYNDGMVTPEMEKIFGASDADFKTVMEKYKASENRSLAIKTFSLPVMDSLLGDIWVFDSQFQREILELRSQVDILNQEIENCMQYFFLTFDPSTMSANATVLNTNLKESHGLIADRCKIVVSKIDVIIDK
ncbi:MAG: hypothetical protein AAB442_01935 [Patescibacteria group bacterium]